MATSCMELVYVIGLHYYGFGPVQLADFVGPVIKMITFCLDFFLVLAAKQSGN